MNALEKTITLVGSQAKLARLIGVSDAHVAYWKKAGVPIRWVEQFEIATGGVINRLDLRPDFYSPESLIEAKRVRAEALATQTTPKTPQYEDPAQSEAA